MNERSETFPCGPFQSSVLQISNHSFLSKNSTKKKLSKVSEILEKKPDFRWNEP